MYRLFVFAAALALLSLDAARAEEPVATDVRAATATTAPVAPQGDAPPTTAPVKVIAMEDVAGKTVCESVTLPGSRIVVRKTCYTVNPYDKAQARELAARDQITKNRVAELRREQAYMERKQRDIDLARERAVAHQLMQ
jgi:hypothetical protein